MELSLRSKKTLILMFTVAMMLLLVYEALSTVRSIREINRLWENYSQEAVRFEKELSHVRSDLGYGGIIHDFKHYLLRHDEELLPKIEAGFDQLFLSISHFEGLKLTRFERSSIAVVRAIALQYQNKFALLRQLVKEGRSPQEIDRLVRVDDKPALVALEKLSQWTDERMERHLKEAQSLGEKAITRILFSLILVPLVIFLSILLIRYLREVDRANRQLEISRKELNAIITNAPDAMLTLMPSSGQIISANRQAELLFGYSSEELLSLNLDGLLPERFRQGHNDMVMNFAQAEAKREIRQDRVFFALHKNGDELPVEIGLSVMKEGDDVKIIATLRNVRERFESERRIKELNRVLTNQNTELEAVNKELEAFSYSVSHDLRAPLRSIDGFSELVLRKYSECVDDTGQDYLQRIRNATQRMGQLIDDMLQLSRMTRVEMHPESLDLTAIAHEVKSELEKGDSGRDVEWQLAEGMRAEGDPGLIRLVLDNLLGNAWKYSSKVEQPRIVFERCEIEEGLCFVVRDNGAGFDMAYADKLFGTFQRLHGSDEFEGNGVGLSTVQRIIHRHGGRVWAEGELGNGASFYFSLPGAG